MERVDLNSLWTVRSPVSDLGSSRSTFNSIVTSECFRLGRLLDIQDVNFLQLFADSCVYGGMKTIASFFPNLLVTFATAALITAGVLASGQSPDAAALLSILFAAGVAGWTFAQYRNAPGPLEAVRPMCLPIRRACPVSGECPAVSLAV